MSVKWANECKDIHLSTTANVGSIIDVEVGRGVGHIYNFKEKLRHMKTTVKYGKRKKMQIYSMGYTPHELYK